jgi:hypothetical protein
MVRDFMALFGFQTGLVHVFSLDVLAGGKDVHRGSHFLGCKWINGSMLRRYEGKRG